MSTNFFQPFQVFAKLRVHAVGQNLCILAINDVFLPVQKPSGNLILSGVLYDGDNAFELVGIEVPSAMCL